MKEKTISPWKHIIFFPNISVVKKRDLFLKKKTFLYQISILLLTKISYSLIRLNVKIILKKDYHGLINNNNTYFHSIKYKYLRKLVSFCYAKKMKLHLK